jgi:hypothetical protein
LSKIEATAGLAAQQMKKEMPEEEFSVAGLFGDDY